MFVFLVPFAFFFCPDGCLLILSRLRFFVPWLFFFVPLPTENHTDGVSKRESHWDAKAKCAHLANDNKDWVFLGLSQNGAFLHKHFS